MKILLATDGSRHALAAARALALWLPEHTGQVDVLAVIPKEHKSDRTMLGGRHRIRPGTPHALSGRESAHRGQVALRTVVSEWRGEAGHWVESAARHLTAAGIRTRTIRRRGNPALVIPTEAHSGQYDLVVIGAKGRGDGRFLDVGSVALSVLEHASASVLMVRAPERRTRPAPTPMAPLRVLVATDGGPESADAVQLASRLLNPARTRIRTLAVADRSTGGGLGVRQARAATHAVIEQLASHGLRGDSSVTEGRASAGIVEAAGDADLVVMGSRAVHRMEERHLGSVSLEVARATKASVLVVRHGAPRSLPVLPAGAASENGAAIEVAYRDVAATPEVEARLQRINASLRKLAPRLIHSRVTIGRASARRKKGDLYDVRLDVSLPGRKIAVTHTTPEHRQSESLLTALDETLQKARRALTEAREDRSERRGVRAASRRSRTLQ